MGIIPGAVHIQRAIITHVRGLLNPADDWSRLSHNDSEEDMHAEYHDQFCMTLNTATPESKTPKDQNATSPQQYTIEKINFSTVQLLQQQLQNFKIFSKKV